MASLFRSGQTMAEIGDAFEVSRERVRQILVKLGVKTSEGGIVVRKRLQLEAKAAKQDSIYQRRYGCSKAVALSIAPKARKVFLGQRWQAKHRRITFRLTLVEWWSIWESSGLFHKRGRALGQYVMARHGDAGGYEVGNVFICSASQNHVDYYRFKEQKKFTPSVRCAS